ncbi:MAG: protoheme IX farnesyltransferase [Acidiferrobacteraceae bacterium]|nr:protoheme IX farnesyltransferase [Acidiferrobacteraceae bacterium]|tara:strand:+ start:2197 stop:3111 length:915 start_codon:yes stop_codon:yes gene_type:complete
MATEITPIAGSSSRFADYIRLLKPRVMSLVVFTALAGLLMAPGAIHPLDGFISICAIAIGAGAAGAINMWYDRDIDAMMRRTLNRPLPAGRLHPTEALLLGVTLSCLSVSTLTLISNYLSGILLAVTIFYYVVLYTIWLKRKTPQNVVIGGVSGALPPVVGWTAVTGSIDLGAILLFAIIFLWTPPHSWALALFRHEDYSAADIPMLPVAQGRKATGQQILFYSLLLVIVTLAPMPFGLAGAFYEVAAVALGVGFAFYALQLFRSLSNKDSAETDAETAKKLFKYSIRYLFLIFLFLLIDSYLI